MSEQTKIAWCDSTVNFWEGCTKVSSGCANCYAESRDKRFTGGKLWGKGATRRKSKSAVKNALAFNRKPWICDVCGEAFTNEQVPPACQSGEVKTVCPECGMYSSVHRRRIFSLSLGDWLDDEVPIEWLAEMLDTIRQCDQVTWILCSKRWENWNKQIYAAIDNSKTAWWLQCWDEGTKIPSNIIGLCSVENQEAADKRIPQFLTVPLACRGLSMEPLLGPVELLSSRCLHGDGFETPLGVKISWLIVGGESGPNARPCNVDWIRLLVQQGKAAGVATFVKQLGAKVTDAHGWWDLNHPKGCDQAEWPADLRVQEFPRL